MFIPLYDYNVLRTIKTPVVTRSLIVVTVLFTALGLQLQSQSEKQKPTP